MSDTPRDLAPLAAALAGLAPRPGGLNRDTILFEAGRRAAPRRWLWPALASGFAALSAGLGLSILLRPEPQPRIVERFTAPPPPAPDHEIEKQPFAMEKPHEASWGNAFRSSAGYLSRRDQALYFGVESLPATPPLPAGPEKPVADLQELHKHI